MSDLKLVAPDQPTPLERLLMNAAQNEAPSAEQRMRVRAALGLPAVAVVPPAAIQAGRRSALLKLGAGGLIVVSAAVVLLLTSAGRSPQPAAVGVATEKVAAPQLGNAPIATGRAAATPAADLPVAQPLPPLEEASNGAPASKTQLKSASRVASPAQSAADGTDLTEQLRLIDAARSAVAAGNAGAAASALSSYRTRFPRGPFRQEATVLQIETLDLQGNHTQASSLARSF